MTKRAKLSSRILVSQVAILFVTMCIGFGLYSWITSDQLGREYQQRALSIAQTTNYTTTSSSLNHAIYANANWDFAERNTLTAGVRLNREISDYMFHTIDSLSSSAASNVGFGTDRRSHGRAERRSV